MQFPLPTFPIVYMYYIHSSVCGHLDFFHKVALTCYLHFLTFSSSLPKQTLVLMNPHEAAGGSQCLPSCQSSVLCLLFLDLLLLFAVTSSWSFWNSPLGKLPTVHAPLTARVPQGQPSAFPPPLPTLHSWGHAAHGSKGHHVLTPKSLSSSHGSLDSSSLRASLAPPPTWITGP